MTAVFGLGVESPRPFARPGLQTPGSAGSTEKNSRLLEV
jgi:hypothetical protein